MENSNQILQRRASKLRAFVPKAVDRKIEGYNENETEVKLPELVSHFLTPTPSKSGLETHTGQSGEMRRYYAPRRQLGPRASLQWNHPRGTRPPRLLEEATRAPPRRQVHVSAVLELGLWLGDATRELAHGKARANANCARYVLQALWHFLRSH